MKQKMTVREKMLLVILGILVLFCLYYFFFLIPTNEKIDFYENEKLSVEEQILVADATAEKKRMMEAELKAIFSGEMGEVKEIPAYDNSHNVMNSLSSILAEAKKYDLSFSSVEIEENTVRRNLSLSFECDSYGACKNILRKIGEGEYRCIFKDLYLDYNDSSEALSYSVKAEIVFFEYK